MGIRFLHYIRYVPRLAALIGVLILLSCAPTAIPQPTAPPPPTLQALPTAATMECSRIHTPPTPTGSLLFPPGAAPDFQRGPADASVTLLLYCDFQSAECELFNQVLDQLIDDHGDYLKVVFRPFGVPPAVVPSLDKSESSVWAALAAAN